MATKKRQKRPPPDTFSAEDIGAELLPIITRGIYRDPLDTLREYIQNAIDARAHHIEVTISPDLVSVRDDGEGMAPDVARAALRLGISDKNPKVDVGFRGIGIYSSFNTCDRLEIYTRRKTSDATRLVFEFERIIERLEAERERRMAGEPPELHLEKLLKDLVYARECSECPIAANGTLVMMVGIQGEVYRRLTDQGQVRQYLESVVPLPFHPDFVHKRDLEAKFRREDYPVVELTLSLEGRSEKLYRPYRNVAFARGRGMGPKFFVLKNLLARGLLGFAWVCLNDARKYLSDKSLRGLLIKKFGFSVGGRQQFAHYFSRSVFNNRCTGEIIVKHPELIPNAARSEFEPGPVRDALEMALDNLATGISRWANKVQEDQKASEVLSEVAPRVFEIVKEVPAVERDVPQLLTLNNELSSLKSQLKTHDKKLAGKQPSLLKKTYEALDQAKSTIAEVLSGHQRRPSDRRRRIERAASVQAHAPKQEDLESVADKPRTLMELVASLDLDLPEGIAALLDYVDKEVLRQKLSAGEYGDFVSDLAAHLEDAL